MRKTGRLCMIFLLAAILTGCGAKEQENRAAKENAKEGAKMAAYQSYLEEKEQNKDLYFACPEISEEGGRTLALAYGKNAVEEEDGYITVSHLSLKNYSGGRVVDVEGSNMDSFSNAAAFLAGDGKLWVPLYGGVGIYTVKGNLLIGNVYTTEMGASTQYSVTGNKRSEPEQADAQTVENILKEQNSKAKPIRFYKNTKENREKYLR